ncbi:hypothetical protein KEJ47_07915 [Candidatus Bathyarchaeota archaeon]|nr:hypothetical protein [Candidatus Bathyarchaeota archaeon]
MQKSNSIKTLGIIILIVAVSIASVFGGYFYAITQTEDEISKLKKQVEALQTTVDRLEAANFELNKTNNQLRNLLIERELEYSALLENYTTLEEEMERLKNESYKLRYEKVEILSIIASWNTWAEQWRLTLDVENSGTCIVILDKVLVNGVEVDSYDDEVPGAGEATTDLKTPYIFYSGKKFTLHVYIDGGPDSWRGVTIGTLVEVKLRTIDGTEYSAETMLI